MKIPFDTTGVHVRHEASRTGTQQTAQTGPPRQGRGVWCSPASAVPQRDCGAVRRGLTMCAAGAAEACDPRSQRLDTRSVTYVASTPFVCSENNKREWELHQGTRRGRAAAKLSYSAPRGSQRAARRSPGRAVSAPGTCRAGIPACLWLLSGLAHVFSEFHEHF